MVGPWAKATGACALASMVGVTAVAAEPCGGLRLDATTVQSGQPLPVKATLAGDDLACAAAVGALLKARPAVRSVTIAAKVPIDRREVGAQAAAAWTKALVSAGIPEARISTVIPTTNPGTPPQLRIAFREPTPRPVALLQATSGAVQAGPDLDKLGPAAIGAQMVSGDVVVTGAAASARLALADGSFATLGSDSAVRIGRIELTSDLKRAVTLQLVKGRIEAIVEYKGKGSSFDVLTTTALAAVRGTRFRVRHLAAGGTGVECLHGRIELQATLGSRASVLVLAGQSARVDAAGNVSPATALLGRPQPQTPLMGDVARTNALAWLPVTGATQYRVDMAGDGELVTRARSYTVAAASLPMPADLPAGHWFWRVTAIDAAETIGIPSKIYSFRVGAP
ncbi:MAG: FecR domain-containing protein [Deltaproteobacteria bacterium]|nr:FecR domain-containing protein [Deltaproteobacteria bacterium]